MNDAEVSQLLAQADAYLSAGRAAEALRLATQCLALVPGHVGASWVAVLALAEQGDFDTAARLAAQAVTANPELSEAWRLLALVLTDQGSSAEALEAAQRAMQLAPDSWLTHETACRVLLGSRSWRLRRRALAEAETARRLAPDEPLAHLVYGDALRARGRFRRAEEAYHLVLQRDPGHRLARGRLGLLELDQSMYLKAFHAFVPLVAESPGDAVTSGHAGIAVWRLASLVGGVMTVMAWTSAVLCTLAAVANGRDRGVFAVVLVFLAVIIVMVLGVNLVRYAPEGRLVAFAWSRQRWLVLAAIVSVAAIVVGLVLWFAVSAWWAAPVMLAGAAAATVLWLGGRHRAKQ